MMKNPKLAAVMLGGVLLASAAFAEAQKRTSSFVIDPSQPYVYLKFDHVGKRQPLSPHESDRGLWIRLVNNCRLPITVAAFDTETTDPGIPVYDEIVPVDMNPPPLGHGLRAGEKPPSAAVQKESIPYGYSAGDVLNTTTVEPGATLLLSFPANHVGPSWQLQIHFYLKLAGQENYGYGPYGVVSFGWPDVPKQFRDAVGQ